MHKWCTLFHRKTPRASGRIVLSRQRTDNSGCKGLMRIARPRIRAALLLTAVVSVDIVALAAQPRPRAGIPAEAWAQADLSVRRLSPDTFGALPAAIRKELTRLGCTIPQTVEDERPHNVI